MTPNNSEVYAGAIVLLLILIAAALFLPPAFARYGAEWVAVIEAVK